VNFGKDKAKYFPRQTFIYTFAAKMKRLSYILLFIVCMLLSANKAEAQNNNLATSINGYMVRACIYQGDTIPWVEMRNIYVYPPMVFKNKRQEMKYYKLIRDVKKVYPIALLVNRCVVETYEFIETLPNEKAKSKHIKNVEKDLKKTYTPMMKKLTFSQGKLLIKLVDRENNQTSYELVKAFMGPFKATIYQAFAALFGASLKKEYDPDGDDKMTERVLTLVENGQL